MSTTAEQLDLRQALSYDPLTGVITWMPGTKFAGQPAGHATKRGHITINRKGVAYQAHQVAWFLHHGTWPANGIDHEDGNPGNNRITNLRDVTQQINNQNKCVRKDSSTKVTGVAWDRLANKWRAYINVAKKPKCLGFFSEFTDACAVRKAAEAQYGYHPNHGRQPSP